MSRCGSSLRGRGVRRKRKPSPIFPNSTAQFHHPQMAASPPPPSAPWKIMPVSWEYCLWLYNERLCFWLVGVHTWPFWEPGDGVSSIRIFSESGMVWSPWKEEVLYLEVANRKKKIQKVPPHTLERAVLSIQWDRYTCASTQPVTDSSRQLVMELASSQDLPLPSLRPLACPFVWVGTFEGELAHFHYAAPLHHPSLCPCTQHDNHSVAWDEILILLFIHQPADKNSPGSNMAKEPGRSLHRCETRLNSGTIGV